MSSSPTPTPKTETDSTDTATMTTSSTTTTDATTEKEKEAEAKTSTDNQELMEEANEEGKVAAADEDKSKEATSTTTSTTTTDGAAKKEATANSSEEKVESTTIINKKRPATESSTTTAAASAAASAGKEEEKGDDDDPIAKRRKVAPAAAASTSNSSKKKAEVEEVDSEDDDAEDEEEDSDEILDICKQIGFKAGDRLEVEWQIQEVDSKDMITRWWGCTLMPFDGRTKKGVAIRQLDYDPYPEGGFPDRCVEDIVFLSHDLLITPDEDAEFKFRAEGQVQFGNEEEARAAINEILMETLNKHATKWKQLDRVSQNYVAKGIAEKKELLVQAIMNHNKSPVITATDMQSILQGIMTKK